jgi:hypothetical protein
VVLCVGGSVSNNAVASFKCFIPGRVQGLETPVGGLSAISPVALGGRMNEAASCLVSVLPRDEGIKV